MQSPIEDFFAGRSLFITGGTGFLGKVLIEKLLRSCSRVKNIYILIRPYKGKTPAERLKEVTELPLFDRLKREQPKALLDKLKALEGDVRELNLGLSEADLITLKREVSLIFHVAATVRFDQPIREAILMNTRGTREVVNLAKAINVDAFVHISTTYCNCNRRIVDEVIYPAPMGWREAIHIAENADQKILNIISEKYLSEFPNSYTFTKNLAEKLVDEECNGIIPTVIFRPSIVISTNEEPIPGWIDNFNGPVGLVIGVAKGVIRVIYSKKEAVPDYMPVDIAIKAIIVACWKQATQTSESSRLKLAIYNASSTTKSISMVELMRLGLAASFDYPFEDTLWFPRVMFTPDKTCFYVNTMFKQIIPALLVDSIVYFNKKTPINLMKIQKKIYQAGTALSYFTSKSWWFINDNFLLLLNEIAECDKESFDFNYMKIDPESYLTSAVVGGHKYLLGTDLSRLPIAKKKFKRMYYLDLAVKILFWIFVFYVLYIKWIKVLINDYFNN